jgi:hypothetical protein
MRTAAPQQPDLTSAPKALEWAVYVREHVRLSASARSLAFLLITLGQGQNISMSVSGMAGSTGMSRNTIKTAIKELHANGLIVVKATGRNQTTIYRLTLPRWSVVDHQGGQQETTKVVNEGPPRWSAGDHNIEERDEDRDDEININMRSAQDDDVSLQSPSSSAGDQSARCPVEVYVSDLEDCVDDLAARLKMDPGKINIKVLATKWRDTVSRHNENAGASALLDAWPADDPIWDVLAGKARPVGYLLDELERWLTEGDDACCRWPLPQ